MHLEVPEISLLLKQILIPRYPNLNYEDLAKVIKMGTVKSYGVEFKQTSGILYDQILNQHEKGEQRSLT